jgi:hypothetical protein
LGSQLNTPNESIRFAAVALIADTSSSAIVPFHRAVVSFPENTIFQQLAWLLANGATITDVTGRKRRCNAVIIFIVFLIQKKTSEKVK